MALVSSGYNLTVTLVDSALDPSSLHYVLRATSHADALTAAQTIVTRLSAVTRAAIKSWTLAERYEEDSLSLPLGVNIEERATVVLQIDGAVGKTAVINIPAPLSTLFVATTGAGANDINPNNAALTSYVSIWHAGASGLATISDGEFVETANNGILRGRRTHRSSSYG